MVQKQDGAVSQGFEATGLLSDKNDEATKAAFVSKAMELSHYRPKRELLDAWAHNSGDAILWFRDILDAEAAGDGTELQAMLSLNEVGADALALARAYAPDLDGDGRH